MMAPSDGGNCSFAWPQIEKRRNAAVPPSSPIRPQLEKDRAAAVRIAHLYGRKYGKGVMRPYHLPPRYGRNWKKTELRPCGLLIYTAANEKRQSCGRTDCSFIRPQIAKRQNAAVLPASPIRPQLEKDRAAAVRNNRSGKIEICVPAERCLEKTCEGKMNNRRNKQRKGIVRVQPGTEFSRKTVFHGNTRSAFLLLPRTPRLTATDYGRFSIINAINAIIN